MVYYDANKDEKRGPLPQRFLPPPCAKKGIPAPPPPPEAEAAPCVMPHHWEPPNCTKNGEPCVVNKYASGKESEWKT